MEDCHSNIHALTTDEKSAKVNNVDGEDINVHSTEEIVASLRSMQNSAQVVLDSGFGTHEGECDIVYRNRRDLAKNAADRLELLQSELLQKTQELEQALKDVDNAWNSGYSDGYQDGTKGI